MFCADIFLGLIAILFPPIAVWIKCGLCSADSLINILLCMLGYIPGLLHAWYIIARHPEINYDYEPVDAESQRVTYYVVSHDPSGRNYGTQGQRQAKSAVKPSQAAHTQPLLRNNAAGAGSSSAPPARSQQAAQPSAAGPSQAAREDEQSGVPPPSYSEVVKGDNKVQRQD